MTIDTTILVLVSFFSILAGVFMPFAYFSYKAWRMKKEALKKIQKQVPMFGPIKPGTTCDALDIGRHDWKSVPIVKREEFDPNNPQPKDTLVCMKCGVMSGTNEQFSPEGLEALKKNLAVAEEAKAFSQELEEFRKKELERRFFSFMEKSLVPEKDPELLRAFHKKLYDLGVQSVEEIASEINMKIQRKQQERMMETIKRLHENSTNV